MEAQLNHRAPTFSSSPCQATHLSYSSFVPVPKPSWAILCTVAVIAVDVNARRWGVGIAIRVLARVMAGRSLLGASLGQERAKTSIRYRSQDVCVARRSGGSSLRHCKVRPYRRARPNGFCGVGRGYAERRACSREMARRTERRDGQCRGCRVSYCMVPVNVILENLLHSAVF